MVAPAGEKPGEVSRRKFLKFGGTVAAAAVVGIGLGNSILLPKQERTATNLPGSISPRTAPPAKPKSLGASFSIFWITDTQYLSESNPAMFQNMTTWIVDQWTARNGKLVIHTGDLVETGSVQAEWVNADAAMSVLLNNGIPYAWCAGNHDDIVLGEPSSGWNGSQWTYTLNPTVVSSQINLMPDTTWVSDHHDGMNTAVAFSANGLDFLVVAIEWNADSRSVLKWVDDLLSDPKYANHYVIIAPHAYINEKGTTDDPVWGPQLSTFARGLTAIMDRHSLNVFLTLNGHFPADIGYHAPLSNDNRHELMFDRQESTDDPRQPIGNSSTRDAERVGGATVTVLTFHTTENLVSVETYDTFAGSYRKDGMERFSFKMFPMLQSLDQSRGAPLPDPNSAIRSGTGLTLRPPASSA